MDADVLAQPLMIFNLSLNNVPSKSWRELTFDCLGLRFLICPSSEFTRFGSSFVLARSGFVIAISNIACSIARSMEKRQALKGIPSKW